MDKKLIKKMGKIINEAATMQVKLCPEVIDEESYAQRISILIKEAGYCKISGEPPRLTDEELSKLLWVDGELIDSNVTHMARTIAEAQRDADVRFYNENIHA